MATPFPAESVRYTALESEGRRFNVAYAEEGPTDAAAATLVCLHGAPGTHQDFKRLREPAAEAKLRLLLPNFPGFGLTTPTSPSQPRFPQLEPQRAAFTEAFLGAVETGPAPVLVGHSAGGFTALRLAAESAQIGGVVLVNPGCLRPHQGMQPEWGVKLFDRLFAFPLTRWLIAPIAFLVLRYLIRLPVASVEETRSSCEMVARMDWEGQRRAAAALGRRAGLPILLLYGGNDQIIQEERSEELAKELGCGTPIRHQSEEETASALSAAVAAGRLHNAVCFPQDGHFVFKRHAALAIRLLNLALRR